MGKIIEFIFTRVYVAMLVTGIFWVLTICGGVLLGVGPASATIMSLYAENGMTYKDYHWSRAWELFKENLRPANQVFYTFFAIEGTFVRFSSSSLEPRYLASLATICQPFSFSS